MQPVTTSHHNDRLTVASLGVLAGTLAAVAHEAVGHGSGCLAVGGRIMLLTSIFFKCAGGTGLTDVAGPIGSLTFGVITAAALKLFTPSTWPRFLLLMSALISLGWFAGQAIYSAALNRDDWAFFARSQGWPPIWRPIVGAAGACTYVWAARVLAAYSKSSETNAALTAATASAALAGLLWTKAPLQSALEGAAAVGIAPAILLLLSKRRRMASDESTPLGSRSWPWVAVAAASYALFLIWPSRGLGPLS